MASDIMSFVHCRTCIDAGRKHRLTVGLIDPETLRVWCATCNRLIHDFELATPMPMRCDACGEQMTKGHKH